MGLFFFLTVFMMWKRAETKEYSVVDLTHPLSSSTIYWPGSPDFNFTILQRLQTEEFWYESNYVGTPEHGGTHLDAPAHFYKGMWRVHEIPPERLLGMGVVINVTETALQNPDYRVLPSDIINWESQHGNIPSGSIVLMKSGWSLRYSDPEKAFNTNDSSDPNTFHFPAYHEDTIEWLVKNRNISMVGTDTASVDYGQTKTFPVHQLLGKNNIPGLENVANLESIPEFGATIYVGIIKLHDGSGGPVRILATFNGEVSLSSSTYLNIPVTLICLMLVFSCFLLEDRINIVLFNY